MARFYPQLTPENLDFHGSLAEEKVYAKLQTLPDRVRVFHSFSWASKQHHKYKKTGEADFIIFDPQFGILVVEVKGGGISYRDGIWWQEDGTGARKLAKDPWTQADDSKYFLIRLLQDRVPEVFLPIQSCVWFADSNITNDNKRYFPHHVRPFAVLGSAECSDDISMEKVLASVWENYYSVPNIQYRFSLKK